MNLRRLEEFFATKSYPTPNIEFLQPFLDKSKDNLKSESQHKKSKSKGSSTGTRAPKYYDLHLHEDLQMKKVVVLKHLDKALASICDEFLNPGHPVHLLPTDSFTRTPDHSYISDKADSFLRLREAANLIDNRRRIEHEEVVRQSYNIYNAPAFTSLASRLAFLTESNILNWSTTHNEPQENAIADGFLSFNSDLRRRLAGLPTSIQNDIELIYKHKLDTLAVWEDKSPFAGSETTMTKLVQPQNPFHWRTCQIGVQADQKKQNVCSVKYHDIDGHVAVTGRRTGPDAKDRMFLEEAIRLSQQSVDTDGDDGDEDYSKLGDPTNKKAGDMLQQVWAAAVKHDCTFMVLSSGKFEVICVRERETGTMYLSKLLRPAESDNPAHCKLHVALYIHAYRDALDRAKQMDSFFQPDVPQDRLPRLYRLQFAKMPMPDSYPNLIQELRTKQFIKLRLSTKHEDSSNYRLWQNISSLNTEISALETSSPPQPRSVSEWSFDTDRATPATSSRVFSTIAFKQSQSFSDKLVIKFAEGKRQCEDLALQFRFHRDVEGMAGNDHGLRAFGLFQQIGANPLFCAMIMEHAGTGYARNSKHCKEHKEGFHTLLEKIHSQGLVHGNLQRDHLLMKKDGKVAFVGSRAFKGKQCELEELRNDEMELLRRWVPLDSSPVQQ
ncbi:hypothetical protein D9613_007204 [Agrocybe pediades]|uniref:Protein kinase domain-containing protein n=1 Tax=Agrocybe pediades TaxID=84607 RepID=A0A8H4QGN0_9AGAR|nr:hypothetical protein D9613_007204 [Agrocybe pediades]